MSGKDRERWDRRYTAGNPNPTFAPELLLEQFRHLLAGRGWALDLACGVGHNAMFLARCGYDVLAVDTSLVGLKYGRLGLRGASLPVYFVAADLDNFALPYNVFDVVVVFRFLSRPLWSHIKQAVAPGGLLIQQTFNVNRLRVTPKMNPDYLLQPGELAQAFADFETIATNDAADITAELTYWVGRRPG